MMFFMSRHSHPLLSTYKWAALVCLLLSSSLVPRSYGQESEKVQGDWQGTFQEGQSLLYRLDYGGKGTAYWEVKAREEEPVTHTVVGHEITIQLPTGTTYTATLSGRQMDGKLTNPLRTVELTLTKKATAADSGGEASIEGEWQGLLPGNMPIVLRLNNDGTDGHVTMVTDIKSEPIQYSVAGNQVTITGAKATYTGTVNGNRMTGKWSRPVETRPINLTRAAIPKITGTLPTAASTHDTIHDAAANGDLAEIRKLLNTDPDLVFAKDNKGETPLHTAAYTDHKDVVEFLLANRAEVNPKDNNGLTPLGLASLYGYQDVVELLRQHGGHE